MPPLLQTLPVGAPRVGLDDFVPDPPFVPAPGTAAPDGDEALIDGVVLTPIVPRADGRGVLHELLTADPGEDPIVHVYGVTAAPGSVRAWVIHRRQDDRLAFTHGDFEVALYDLRPDSPTHGRLQVLRVGRARPVRLRIPSLVAHGVRNAGAEEARFVNLPTRAYDPAAPDKSRLAPDDPRVPYRFG